NNTSQSWLLRVLGKCHAVAHVEKELSDQDIATKQPKNDTRLSTAYGFEGGPVTGLTVLLDSLPFNALTDRSTFIPSMRKSFKQALGDTRRPVNEVTLADWSETVATLYKSALAGGLLGIKPDPDALHWRLLCVNFDVLGLYAKAIKIADLLGYQRVVDQTCAVVKQLVEEEYPLGNEVYRDTTGIYFTFPDLDLPADLTQKIRRCVEAVEPELAPRIAVTVGDGQTATEQLKGILAKARKEALEALVQPFDDQNLSNYWEQEWEKVQKPHTETHDSNNKWEICPVCRLRPKLENQDACEHCENRRQGRVTAWRNEPQTTIWMDELADANGRVALIVGKFGLEDWLSGNLVQTMLVRAKPNDPAGCTPKNPSPARLRRVWETCQRFWTETAEQEILARHDYSKGDTLRCARCLVIPDRKTGWKEGVPYDGTVKGKAISFLWQAQGQYFVTISNLQGVGEIQQGAEINVAEPYDPSHKITFTVQGVIKMPSGMDTYMPYLLLLASPDQFLALVPAADAPDIADKIREEYAKQFGKVQNRLPLFLGLVFFQRKMPLFAVMDTGRRMLETPLQEELWRVEYCRSDTDADGNKQQYLRLSQGKQRMIMKFPIKMGDNTTDDIWYPYVFVKRFADGTLDNRRYRFQHNGCWLVHVCDLKDDDVVMVNPSRFAYLWLDHTAQRFTFDPALNMLLLEELPRLMQMWEALKTSGITITSLRNLQSLLEVKGVAWGMNSEEFGHLAETALKDAGLFQLRDKDDNPLPDVITPEDVISKRFARCLELYLYILKQKFKED
ncbi:MAG TPA: CRISPR-associated protein Csx11, partial [Myxococcota bacterium]|nr:CRISPR-associated protein Csx11 [Myxococcota bacterium]HRV18821.1 CRISPR-associated protein Csx11 [Myxococcota bacterium]